MISLKVKTQKTKTNEQARHLKLLKLNLGVPTQNIGCLRSKNWIHILQNFGMDLEKKVGMIWKIETMRNIQCAA